MFAEIITAIVLGTIQGLTEFIPVSSSGHLLLTTELLNLTNSSFGFELALNLGTLLALICYFWRDILSIMKTLTKPKAESLPVKIIIATIPAVAIGALALPLVSTVLRSPTVAIVALIVVGIIMVLSDRLVGPKAIDDLSVKDSILIGLAQALAFIPGTSRSGSTIIAGRLIGLSHKQAARFSFLMAIPIVAAALVLLAFEYNGQEMIGSYISLSIGIITSFLVGLWAIHFMLKFLEKHGLKSFGYYRIIIGLVVLFILINRGVI
jgi:undecaprenyl-diphosphatase